MLEIDLSPNPTSRFLNLNFKSQGAKGKLKVINTSGQIILEKNIFSQNGIFQDQFDVSRLNNGVYILLVQDERRGDCKKFIKQ
ncbi:T9SS type A sorting domain-containing protein [Flavobacterium sp. LC2016-12]|uniref:T9SS type A sorting domain-containing protein n=1 Tax=Flavobacterium sp. LC2016-12 TaxID=2783794 RepID=UPI00188DAAF8|nr:T9SS type A sorting domain-containing protein [Flavobacterium sp. LC2016-12]MBF4464581.1 T9SS type A sorting domain-containing protein [Flavobacterium sp. LC2016-12]